MNKSTQPTYFTPQDDNIILVLYSELQKFITLYGTNQLETKAVLAKEVLAEIPEQLVHQMKRIQGIVTTV